MANILYITPDFYTKARFAGGMGTKTKAIQSAWSIDHKIDIAPEPDPEKSESYDVVLIELLGLRNDKRLEERIEMLKMCPVPKLVYGSDSEIFRWTGKELDALKEIVTLWIPNCSWQADYFRDFDLPVSSVVHEPIDCDIFRPGEEREKTIVAGGAICLEKNTEFFIELFSALKKIKKEYKVAYLGSAGLWGDLKAVNLRLEAELSDITDIFYGSVPQAKVASVLGAAAVGILNPHYETCNRFHMELQSCGTPTVCSPHILYDERPVTKRFKTLDACINVLGELTSDWTELPSPEFGKIERAFAKENFSYEASLEKLNEILRSVL